ncbi:MAG: response regulator transcription factor [Magnetococcales bacterium]|nr:response regulator transcription factor [Magnetococcales bacterium]
MTDTTRPRLLLVDDDESLRQLFATVLDASGFEVVAQAGDGRSGVQLFTAHSPDMVLLDIEMPVMNGIQALKTMMKNNPKAVVVMLTSIQSVGVWDDCLLAGATGYIRKDTPLMEIPSQLMKLWKGTR